MSGLRGMSDPLIMYAGEDTEPTSACTALVLVDPDGHAGRMADQRFDASLSRDVKAALRDAMMIDDAMYAVGDRLRKAMRALFPEVEEGSLVVLCGWQPTEEELSRPLSERYHPRLAAWAAREHRRRHVHRRRLTIERDPFP